MAYITSDSHFGHANIIRYCDRPFASVTEMDSTLISSWNRVVNPNSIIYHLGDFTLAPTKWALHYFSQLNGRIFLVPGGHDYRWITDTPFLSKSGHPVIILSPLSVIKYQRHSFVLCHYPLQSWPSNHYGSIHLHGHSHGKLERMSHRMDIGVDSVGYTPITLDHIISTLTRESIPKPIMEGVL